MDQGGTIHLRVVLALALVSLAAVSSGCSSILGIEDARLDDPPGTDDTTADTTGGDGDGDGDAPGFAITAGPGPFRLDRTGSVMIEINVEIEEGFDDRVGFLTSGLPASVTQVDFAADVDESGPLFIAYQAGPGSPLGFASVTLEATAEGSGDVQMADLTLLIGDTAGTLDQSFGGAGDLPRPQGIVGVEVLGDGKILTLAFPNILQRLLPDGAVDMTYGVNGRVEGPMNEVPRFLFQTSDGKTLVVSEEPGLRDVIVRRYLASGAIDSAFGTGGVVVLDQATGVMSADVDSFDSLFLIAFAESGDLNQFGIQPNGMSTFLNMTPPGNEQRLIGRPAGGYIVAERGPTTQVVFTAFLPTGLRDTAYASGGIAELEIGQDCFFPTVLGPRVEGIMSAWACMNGTFLIAVTPDGRLDTSFATTGVSMLFEPAEISTLATDGAGTTLIGTFSPPATMQPAFIDRVLPNGMFDNSFQRVLKSGMNMMDEVSYRDLELQPDGRIVAVGALMGPGFIQRIWN